MFWPKAKLALKIVPFSNYNLQDENFCAILEWYKRWQNKDVEFKAIRENV